MHEGLTSIDKFRLDYSKFVSLAAVLLYPGAGYILKLIDPNAIEYLSHRWLIAAYFVLLFAGLHYNKVVQKYALPLLVSGLTVGVIWCVWIVHVNEFSHNYSVVLISAIGATAISIMSRTHLVIYLIISTLALCVAILSGEYQYVNPIAAMLANVILGVILLISNTYKERMHVEIEQLNNKLTENNHALEEKVAIRTKMLKNKNAELENFVYIVSHDLKSPLRNIASFSQLIKTRIEEGTFDSIGNYSGVVEKGVEQMSGLLDDLLEYGSVGEATKMFSEMDLRSCLVSVIENNFSSHKYQKDQIVLHGRFPGSIVADQKQLSLLFQNLVENALKYNHSDPKKVEISYDSSESFHLVRVRDNGIGIRREDKQHIFKMFKRLHTEEEFEGTGIGLAICHRIAENHLGTIEIGPRQGQGTDFIVRLARNLWSEISEEERDYLKQLNIESPTHIDK